MASVVAVPAQALSQRGDVKVGRSLYETECATCHGRSGKGDGEAAAIMTPKPGDHTNGKAMNALSDEFLFAIIRKGGGAVKRSTKMPPAPKRLTDREVDDLLAYVRSLSANPPYRLGSVPPKR
jgi:mono/diheme cytochrome c family protein